MSAHGSKLESSACPRCDDGSCKQCRQVLRVFRLAVRRGVSQPGFARKMLSAGDVVSGARVMEGGLPVKVTTESLLFRVARAVQAERKAENAG